MMRLRKKYVLADFTKYGAENFPNKFAAVADMDLYEFADKTWLDEKHDAHRMHMLSVGHYSRRSGGPPVWAHATGTCVRYYSGAGVQVTPLIQDIHSSKVYYDPPFTFMGGSQDSSNGRTGMTQERKRERAVVETMINFVFLTSGRLGSAMDLNDPDMLRNFKVACRNFYRHRKTDETVPCALQQQPLGTNTGNATTPTQVRPSGSSERIPVLALPDRTSSSLVPAKRSFVDLIDDSTSSLLHGSSKSTLLVEQRNDYEAELHTTLAREVQGLKAKLAEHEATISTTEAKLIRERTKRRAAAKGYREWKERHAALEGSTQSATPNDIKQEDAEPDWKSMLFEQERKTEMYKVKYIESKEKMRKQEAQVSLHNKDIEVLHNKTVEVLHNKIVDCEQQLRDLQTKVANSEKVAAGWKSEYDAREKEAANLRERLAYQNGVPAMSPFVVAEREKEIGELIARLDDVTKELADKTRLWTDANQEMNRWRSECVVLRAKQKHWLNSERERTKEKTTMSFQRPTPQYQASSLYDRPPERYDGSRVPYR